MSSTVIPGLSQSAEGIVLAAVSALYHNNVTPILDNTGAALLPVVQAAYASVPPDGTPQILVHIEDGSVQTFESGGLAGWDADANAWKRVAILPDSRIVFTIDANLPALRRRLVDTLRWGIMTAYSVDGNGVRQDACLITYMAQYGIHLQRYPRPIFDAPEYDPPNPAAPRPFGETFTARVKMRADLEVVWWTPAITNPQAAVYFTPPNTPNPLYVPPL